nr:TadE family protein [Agromyces intestinalis]
MTRLVEDERGSAVAEFVLVSILLTTLALAVVQLALALHVRNTLLDAAAEGARYAAISGTTDVEGAERTRDLIATALGDAYGQHINVDRSDRDGVPTVAITVRATLPVVGLIGLDRGLEVTGHAAVELVE